MKHVAFLLGAALGCAFYVVGLALDAADRAYDRIASKFAIPPRRNDA